jgi:predicted amidohydrolase
MKWVPARLYDNAVYVVFPNLIGMNDDQLKNGCSMIIVPFGDVIVECTKLDEEIATAVCPPKKLRQAGGSNIVMPGGRCYIGRLSGWSTHQS